MEADGGSAIEVYPPTHTLRAGDEQVACDVGDRRAGPTFAHAAIKSSMSEMAVAEAAQAEGLPARTCNRGPFQCVEIWLENRLLVEVLDPTLQLD